MREQLWQSPFRYKDENGEWKSITRNLNWIQHPVQFHRPQADLVRNRDYSFVQKGNKISVNTLGKRAIMSYDAPECFAGFFDGSWTFGTGKLVSLLGEWYLHIPATREVDDATLAELDSYAILLASTAASGSSLSAMMKRAKPPLSPAGRSWKIGNPLQMYGSNCSPGAPNLQSGR